MRPKLQDSGLETNISSHQAGRWGPKGRRGAVSLTFDQLAGEPTNAKPTTESGAYLPDSLTKVLPAILDLLAARKITSSFFIDGWNVDAYPERLRAIAAAGHEIGSHGFRHEKWPELDAGREEELLAAITQAHSRLGVPLDGFRPPNAGTTEQTMRLLRTFGFRYASLPNAGRGFRPSLGSRGHVEDGLALVPFSWNGVDANYLRPGPDRVAKRGSQGFQGTGEGPDALVAGFLGVVEETVDAGDCVALYWHVPYQDSPECISAIASLADKLLADDRVWLASCRQMVDWMFGHPDQFR